MALWKCPEPECLALNKSTADSCEVCGETRPSRRKKAGEATPRFDPDQCSRCDATSKSVAPFHPDDPEALPEDRGKRLCPSCWIGALQRRAAGQTRETTCTEPGCDKTVGEHIEEFRRYGERITARILARTTPW